MKLYSTAELTERLQKAGSTVRMLVAKHNIGQKVSGRWVFTDADIYALKQIPGPGRPKKARN